jgi:hypothetical protein
MEVLDSYLWQNVCSYLDPDSINSLRSVSHYMRQCIHDNEYFVIMRKIDKLYENHDMNKKYHVLPRDFITAVLTSNYTFNCLLNYSINMQNFIGRQEAHFLLYDKVTSCAQTGLNVCPSCNVILKEYLTRLCCDTGRDFIKNAWFHQTSSHINSHALYTIRSNNGLALVWSGSYTKELVKWCRENGAPIIGETSRFNWYELSNIITCKHHIPHFNDKNNCIVISGNELDELRMRIPMTRFFIQDLSGDTIIPWNYDSIYTDYRIKNHDRFLIELKERYDVLEKDVIELFGRK